MQRTRQNDLACQIKNQLAAVRRLAVPVTLTTLMAACGGGGSSSVPVSGSSSEPAMTVTSVTPADGATGVEPDVTLGAEFNRDVLVSSINGSGALALESSEGQVPLTVNVDTASSVTLDPDVPLDLLTEYTVTATTDITDSEGHALGSDYQWQFMTRDGSWADAGLIENESGDAAAPAIAMDQAGNAMVVWRQTDNGTDEVMLRRYDATADAWVPSSSLDSSAHGISEPDVAMDSSGNALVVWNSQLYENGSYYLQVFARYWSADTESWSVMKQISSDDIEGFFNPRIGFDDSGNAIAVWIREPADSNDPDALVYNRYNAGVGSWGSPAEAFDIEKDRYEALDMAVDTQGNAIVVWVNADDSYLPDAVNSVQASRFDAVTGNWSVPLRLDSYNASGEAHDPQVIFDVEGNAHVAWWRDRRTEPSIFGQVYANRYDAETGGWNTSATRILGARDDDEGRFPTLAVNEAGEAIMAIEAGEVYVSRFEGSDETWSTAESVSDYGGGPQGDIGLDERGNALVVWKKKEGSAYNLFASRSAAIAPAWTQEERIETLGSDASRPLLEMDVNGNAIAVWEDTGTIYTNRFNFE